MTSIRPAGDPDMAAVADLWHAGWHDGHAGHVPEGLTAARTLAAFHERTPTRVADTTVAVSPSGELVGFVMVVGDEVEQVFVSRGARGSGLAGVLLDEAESAELMTMTQQALRAIRAVSRPHSFNIGLNLGRSAGGSLSEHLHQHVVPRWTGDANFITVVGGTKMLPQLLEDTRTLLADAWPGDQPTG